MIHGALLGAKKIFTTGDSENARVVSVVFESVYGSKNELLQRSQSDPPLLPEGPFRSVVDDSNVNRVKILGHPKQLEFSASEAPSRLLSYFLRAWNLRIRPYFTNFQVTYRNFLSVRPILNSRMVLPGNKKKLKIETTNKRPVLLNRVAYKLLNSITRATICKNAYEQGLIPTA